MFVLLKVESTEQKLPLSCLSELCMGCLHLLAWILWGVSLFVFFQWAKQIVSYAGSFLVSLTSSMY